MYTPELIDAIKEQYTDDPQLQIEILQELSQDKINIDLIKAELESLCAINKICPRCLSSMELHMYKDQRPYQESVAYEPMSTLICRNCGYEL